MVIEEGGLGGVIDGELFIIFFVFYFIYLLCLLKKLKKWILLWLVK